jgi:hypothetical protein
MGKRPAGVELFEGNMASMQWEIRPSIQRGGTPTMETGPERIAGRLLRPSSVALQGAAGPRSTANQRPKSVVQQICTLRSVGVGGG